MMKGRQCVYFGCSEFLGARKGGGRRSHKSYSEQISPNFKGVSG